MLIFKAYGKLQHHGIMAEFIPKLLADFKRVGA